MQHLEQCVIGPSFAQVLVATGMVCILELFEIMLEEINISFVIGYQEREDVLCRDQPLKLRFLIGSQSYCIQTVIVNYVNNIKDFAVDV